MERLDRFFERKESNTSVKTECIAGMTTFFAMVYILMVNANMFADSFGDGSNPLGITYGAIYIATAISAIAGTILAGLPANPSFGAGQLLGQCISVYCHAAFDPFMAGCRFEIRFFKTINYIIFFFRSSVLIP